VIGIILIILGFIWLLYETDYLRVRLLVGIETKPIEYEYMSWEDVKTRYFYGLPSRQTPFWYANPEHMEPLCGLAWLENTMHVIPEYRIELDFGGNKYKMTVKEPKVLKEIVKVNTKKHKPYTLPVVNTKGLATSPYWSHKQIERLVNEIAPELIKV